jgi:hypothetical protein
MSAWETKLRTGEVALNAWEMKSQWPQRGANEIENRGHWELCLCDEGRTSALMSLLDFTLQILKFKLHVHMPTERKKVEPMSHRVSPIAKKHPILERSACWAW